MQSSNLVEVEVEVEFEVEIEVGLRLGLGGSQVIKNLVYVAKSSY